MPAPYHNKVVLLTGASSGIGAALVRCLIQQRAKLGILARREQPLRELAEIAKTHGATLEWACADVTNPTQVMEVLGRMREQLGPVDLLIANAGVGGSSRGTSVSVEETNQVFQVNFFGVLHSIAAVLPEMLARGNGHVAAVSSLAAYKGLPGSMAYTASKAALSNYLEGLRIQLHGTGIGVSTICPGFVRTPMTAKHRFRMPFLLEPNQAAARILRSLSRRQAVINFPWPMTLLMFFLRWLPDSLVAQGFPREALEP